MDIIFHAVSAGALAKRLGENRKSALILAALVGINPDILSNIGLFFLPRSIIYPLFHSLAAQGVICLVLLLINRRIAFGGLLHIAVDLFSHKYTTQYLFYPVWRVQLYEGLDWYRLDGIWLWALFWIMLLLIIWRNYRAARRQGQTSS